MAAAGADALRDVPLCARCGHDDANYLDPDAKLVVSRCGHSLCRRCFADSFGRHRSVRCPASGCGETLTRADFSEDTRETVEFRREKEVRRRLSSIFNLTIADFDGDAAAYNAYLERVEVYIANLVTGVDVMETEAAIEEFRARNQRAIAVNNARADSTTRRTEETLRLERERREAGAARTARELAERGVAVERIRIRLASALVLATRGAGGSGTARDAVALAAHRSEALAELATLRKALLAAQAELATAVANAASTAAAPPLAPLVVPCATVFPPRLVRDSGAAGTEAPPHHLPQQILERVLRASGVVRSECDAWALDDTLSQLRLLPPNRRSHDQERHMAIESV